MSVTTLSADLPPNSDKPPVAAPLAPFLIALPHGLNVSGVTLWAVRLANALASQRRVGLVLHAEPPGQDRLAIDLDPRIAVTRLEGLPCLEGAGGDLSPFIPLYRDAVHRLAGVGRGPVVFSPNLLGDCYGIAAALCTAEPERLRVVGWQHSDIEYDGRVLAHYEPILARFAGVSEHIAAGLRARLAARATDVALLPYGVPVPPAPPAREPLAGRPLRLIYTGRMEHRQKRVGALAVLSDELTRRGVEHTLTLVGDGPAAAEIDALIAGSPCMRRLPAQGPARVAALLAASDLFVLASRYEGLSVAMLEAMAAACAPVVARTASGLAESLLATGAGLIADTCPEAGEREAALALADAVELALSRGPAELGRLAWEASKRFSLDRHAALAGDLIDSAAQSPPRPWPASRPCAFTAAPGSMGASGSVPADGPARLRAALERLAGRTVALHGAGQHTRQLAPVLAESPARIVAVADDDRAAHGRTLWGWPIVAPAEIPPGVTDVLISSWMHERAIWERRGVYESRGLRVHRLYGGSRASRPQ